MGKDIKVSTKKVKLRVILFICTLIVAIGSMSYAITNLFKKSPGFYSLEVTDNTEFSGYEDLYPVSLYFDGSSAEIKEDLKTANNDYTVIIGDCLKNYESYYSKSLDYGIGSISNHLNEDIILNLYLYDDLKDAYQKTLNSSSYSIFAEPLYYFWFQLTSNGSMENTLKDPLFNSSNSTFINELSTYINDLTNFELTFTDSTHSVKFKISDSYKQFLTDNMIDCPIISLNVLQDAYICKRVKTSLKYKGYKVGNIQSASGIIDLIGSFDTNITTTGLNKASLALLSFDQEVSVKINDRFINNDYYKSYVANDNSIKYYRNDQINIINGLPNDYYLNTVVISDDIVEATYLNNMLNTIDDETQFNTIKDMFNDVSLIYIRKDQSNVVYYNNKTYVKDITILISDSYTLTQI